MGILSDREIVRAITKKFIVIEPFKRQCLGTNSYDVHLGKTLGIYRNDSLDCKKHNPIEYLEIPETGLLLQPGRLYLGVTEEYTETYDKYVPNIDGKSSIGRLGIFIHITAGKGDVGYKGYWTLEIMVVHPIKIYAGMPIGQLTYEDVSGPIGQAYCEKASSKYGNTNPKPIESKMHLNWSEAEEKWLR